MSDDLKNIIFLSILMGIICAFIIGIITIIYSRVFVESKLINKEKITYRTKKSGYIIFSFITMFLLGWILRQVDRKCFQDGEEDITCR